MQTLIPVPRTPFLDAATGSVSREWFAFFASLLGLANSADDDVLIYGGTPTGSDQTDEALTNAFEAWSQAAANSGLIEALQSRFDGLDPQIPGPQEFAELVALLRGLTPFGAVPTEAVIDARAITPFGMPPTELGSLEAAKNVGFRIVAANHATLIAGTVTVSDVNAIATNEWSLTTKVVGGTQGMLSLGTIVANTSFVLNSSNPADTSTVSWIIFAPIRG